MHLVVSVCVRMYVCVCLYVAKKLPVWDLTTWKSSVSETCCLLIEFNHQKGAYYARRFVLGKKYKIILLMVWEKAKCSEILCMVCHTLSSMQFKAMQCKRIQNAHFGMPTCNCSADLQYSLIPGIHRRRKERLVSAVCACTKFSLKSEKPCYFGILPHMEYA